jgi:hypothetical protein
MNFALVNGSNQVEMIYTSHRAALLEYMECAEPGDGWSVKPIMTFAEWNELPSDHRAYLNGRIAVTYLNEIQDYSNLGYVYLIESWDALQWHPRITMTYRQMIVPELISKIIPQQQAPKDWIEVEA